jgi:hypothetical protein
MAVTASAPNAVSVSILVKFDFNDDQPSAKLTRYPLVALVVTQVV